ncbi:hypothetical protein Taro_032479, partial [Colocasia esculenta]|nr:hypothetical protein [Colocasia esculenta]
SPNAEDEGSPFHSSVAVLLFAVLVTEWEPPPLATFRIPEILTGWRRRHGQTRAQYAEAIALSEDGLVEMLVLDRCFIIEYFVKRVFRQTAKTAPLSVVRWGFSHLRRDLMILENQIPFFVLVKLFCNSKIPFFGTRQEPLTLMEIPLRFLNIKLPMAEHPNPKPFSTFSTCTTSA